MLAVLLSMPAAAENTGKSYTYSFFGSGMHRVPSTIPDPYRVVDVITGYQMVDPQDMVFVTDNNGDGYLYIMNSVSDAEFDGINATGRIVVLDPDFNHVRDIIIHGMPDIQEVHAFTGAVTYVPDTLQGPRGIWVDKQDANPANHFILIADRDGHRIVITDMDGRYIRQIGVPNNPQVLAALLGADADAPDAHIQVLARFLPISVQTDHNGDIFLLSENDYGGIMHLTTEGEFIEYFGAADVVLTGAMAIEIAWRGFFDLIGVRFPPPPILPNQYADFFIAPDGQYIYAVRPTTSSQEELVRKMNRVSVNVLENTGRFGDDFVRERGQPLNTSFNAVIADEDGFITALDSTHRRLFQYTPTGHELYIFGGRGTQRGTFVDPVALAVDGNRLMVLDRGARSITVMEPTYFGRMLRTAQLLWMEGDFEHSLEYWLRVIELNPNYSFAYRAAAEIFYLQGEFEQSMEFARMTFYSPQHSRAFQHVRSEIINDNFAWAFTVFILLLVLIFVWGILRRRGIIVINKVENDQHGKFRYLLRCLFHPIDGFSEMRYNHKQSLMLANACMVFHVFVNLVNMQWRGWNFGGPNQGGVSLPFLLAFTLGYYFLFTMVNWLLGTFLVGKATFRNLWICICYALIPMSVGSLLWTGLSNILTQDEFMIMNYIWQIGMWWSFILIYWAIKETQMFGFIRTFVSILLTMIGMSIVIFIIFLMVALVVQLRDFAGAIWDEAMFRIRSGPNDMPDMSLVLPIVIAAAALVVGAMVFLKWRKRRVRG